MADPLERARALLAGAVDHIGGPEATAKAMALARHMQRHQLLDQVGIGSSAMPSFLELYERELELHDRTKLERSRALHAARQAKDETRQARRELEQARLDIQYQRAQIRKLQLGRHGAAVAEVRELVLDALRVGPRSGTELSKELGRRKSVVLDALSSLERDGLVTSSGNTSTHRYSIGSDQGN